MKHSVNFINECKDNCKIDIIKINKIFDYFIDNNILDGSVELVIINSKNMQELNKTSRGIDKVTDVLSFEYDNSDMMGIGEDEIIGSVLVCYELIEQMANEYKHSFDDELALLFIHGLLHIAMYDHESDDGEHRAKEREIIEFFKLPDSLIIRNNG